ncbi:MAG: hypothetical protein IJX81_06450 [Clostridia bacterium]|nr:hypothetical protein [Clostridia bacterium]
MKTKKILALALCATTLGAGVLSGAACGEQPVVSDGKTVNVAVVSGGYGTTWLNKLAEKFEKAYEEEGYKINVLTPRNNLKNDTALSEMRLGSKTGVDLYLTAGIYLDAVLDEDYGVCVENLNDVYNNGAINFDGSVEATPIKDKVSENQYYLLKEGNDWYKFHYFTAPLGIVANTKILAEYGITELPRTTNELFEAYDAIYYGANGVEGTKDTGVYPTVWAGDNAYGYPYNGALDMLCQLMGKEAFEDDFFTLNSVLELDDMTQGYSVYEKYDDYYKACIEVFLQQYDVVYSVLGSASQRHDQAHAQLVRGNAAFMSDGAYFFNEVRANFSTRLNDIRMMQTPMISYLGVDLKLDGTGTDEEKCDEILSYMTKLVDEGKTNAEIETMTETQFAGVDISQTQVEKIVAARGVGATSYQADGYITKGSPMKDVAALFLRMMASQDAADLWSEYGLMSAYEKSGKTEYDYQFLKDAADIHNANTNQLFYSSTYGLRKAMATSVAFGDYFSASMVTNITADVGAVASPSERNYAEIANSLYKSSLDGVKKSWPDYLDVAKKYIDGVKNNG